MTLYLFSAVRNECFLVYHWLELPPMSTPKPITTNGSGSTMIGLEKHWDHAEKSRPFSKWDSAKERRSLLSFWQSPTWRRDSERRGNGFSGGM